MSSTLKGEVCTWGICGGMEQIEFAQAGKNVEDRGPVAGLKIFYYLIHAERKEADNQRKLRQSAQQ